MNRMLSVALRVLLRIFFRRVAVAGAELVPTDGPVLFVLNHQNGLVDPIILIGFAPRYSVFLAKSTLFHMPVIGLLVRLLGSIPIYRKADGPVDASQNTHTFRNVWAALERGQAIAIFPEGTSHSEPELKPFKTGAARIALGAAGVTAQGRAVNIVPAGLYYTAKTTFRSSALLYFGAPLVVAPQPVGPDGEASPEAVAALTTKIEQAIAEVTLQADRRESLALATRAERIFTSADATTHGEARLASQFELRQRFVAGYAALRLNAPERLEEIERLIARHEAKLEAVGLNPATLMPAQLDAARVIRYTVKTLATVLFALPVALIGLAINYPAYWFVGPLATRVVKPEVDVIATQTIVAGGMLFPVAWLLVGWLVGRWLGVWWGVTAALAAPFTGYVALRFLERLDHFVGETRGFLLLVSHPTVSLRLVAEEREIRKAILALQREPSVAAPASG
jgi:glycerol-3-phosphate O-acyltransferase/dihydroxyacetone phosphate acyltransferase